MLEATTLEDIWLHDVIKLCSRTHNHPEKANKEKKKKAKCYFVKHKLQCLKERLFSLLSFLLSYK